MLTRGSWLLLLTPTLLAACAADRMEGTSDGELLSDSVQLQAHQGQCKIKCTNPADCLLPKEVDNLRPFPNHAGAHSTYTTSGADHLDLDNAFFKSLGTNGRACVTCHTPEDGWSTGPRNLRERFERSCGTDAIFRTVDGANSPNADVSTLEAKRAAYSLLLNKGLIRIQRPIAPTAEFELVSVDDPYGNDTSSGISVFRRPLPATNLRFIHAVMFDGREPDLVSQARNATLGHAEAAASPPDEVLSSIVAFETSLFTSQVKGSQVGPTTAAGAHGDPVTLSSETFVPFSNAPAPAFGPDGITIVPPTPAFTIYSAWENVPAASSQGKHRRAVARGQALFNDRKFVLATIPGVGSISATCATCHNDENTGGETRTVLAATVGVHNILTSHPAFRTNDLPLYTLRVKATGEMVQTTDPGVALTTGLAADIGAFKTPPLRALAARAPYFHNGMSATLADVVQHYDVVFNMGLTPDEKADLTEFLSVL